MQDPWKIYDEMIEGIPEGIAVKDYALGLNWSCVDAECGCGVAYTLSGGAKRTDLRDLRKVELKEVAKLSKSWNWQEATLGIAALNAYYAQRDRFEAARFPSWDEITCASMGQRKVDVFDLYRPTIEAAEADGGRSQNVVVIGHFPHVEDIAEYANLTVLERNCRNDCDTPDPACEYILPEADFVFMTGVTLENKTAPRLLELSKDARTIMVGPSVVPCQTLFDRGVEMLASRVVMDSEQCMFCVKTGTAFGNALQMVNIKVTA